MTKSEFTIPNQEDLEHFFGEKFRRNPSQQEQNMIGFFHHQTDKALTENMADSRLKLCATMVLMLSPFERRNYCLTTDTFGANDKRSKIAHTIGALFLKDTAALNDLIQDSNNALEQNLNNLHAEEGDRFFEKVNANNAEKSAMQQFCIDYTILLAKEIYVLLTAEEHKVWGTLLPAPTNLANHPADRLQMLGHSVQQIQDLAPEVLQPANVATNSVGYNLRSRSVNVGMGQNL